MKNKSKDKIPQKMLLQKKQSANTIRKGNEQNKDIKKKLPPSVKVIKKEEISVKKQQIKQSNVVVKRQEKKRFEGRMKKEGVIGKMTWNQLPFNMFLAVSEYFSATPYDVYFLSKVCLIWRQLLQGEDAIYFWNRMKGAQNIASFQQLKQYLQKELFQKKEKMSFQFEKMFAKLFNYGSTKENIPNKLIEKLNLEASVSINKKSYHKYPFKLRSFNFSSYLHMKINELSQFKFDLYTAHNIFKDKLEITIKFYSKTFKVGHIFLYKFQPEEIAECAIKQKAFNYFLNKNLILTYFEGDMNFLYSFFEISALELINQFRKVIKSDHEEHLKKKNKNVPLYKQLCQTEFQNFVQYLKFQADFELHLSYHNSLKQIFTHCDTKVYPLEYDQKHAYFQVKIDDSFEKCSTFKLDNKMGMSENIEDLYLMDFVLKDRDRFLIVFSGFIYARNASGKERSSIKNYMDFNQNQIKVLEYKCSQYQFFFTIIEELNRNFIPNAQFSIFPQCLL